MKLILRIALLLICSAMAAPAGRSGIASQTPVDGRGGHASLPTVNPARKGRDDAEAIAALTKAGVPLQRDPAGRVRWIEAVKGEFTDEAMSQLPKLPSLEWLEIGGGKVTAAGMANLAGCTGLKRLYVHDVYLGDEALAGLENLSRLEALSLQRTGITGKVLGHLSAVGTLRVLNLSGDEIENKDLTQLVGLKSLEVLALQGTQVTGSGLAKLAGMARLNELNLSNCRIVDEDLENFITMPNLRIVFADGSDIGDDAVKSLNEKFPMLAIFR